MPRPLKIAFNCLILPGLAAGALDFQAKLLEGFLQSNTLDPQTVLSIQGFVYLVLGIGFYHFLRRYAGRHSRVKELLSNREMEVFKEIVAERSNKEIMEKLFIEKSTLKTHINQIYRKLEVENRQKLIRIYSGR